MKRYTLEEMENLNKSINNHWFDYGAMKFFNTTIETEPNQYNMFITSERMDLDMPKKYSIRWFCPDTYKVHTFGEFQQFGTIDEAQRFINIISKAFKDLANREKDILKNLYKVEFGKDWIVFTACYTFKDKFEYRHFDVSYDGRIVG